MIKKIIIIADRKQPYIDSMWQVLEGHGYEILVAYDSLEGFNMTVAEKPDLVLIDALLSGVNGYQICSLLKCDIKYEDILVVILSEGDGNKYQQLANNSGADGILGKPIDINELLGIIQSLN